MPECALGTQGGQTSAVASRSSRRGRWRGGPLPPAPHPPSSCPLTPVSHPAEALPSKEIGSHCFLLQAMPQAPAQTRVVNGLLEGGREALGPVSRAQGEEAVEGQGRVAGMGGHLDGYSGLPI